MTLLVALWFTPLLYGQQMVTVTGCLASNGGGFTLGAANRAYQVAGNAGQLQSHVNQTVQISGRLNDHTHSGGGTPSIAVERIQMLVASCPAPKDMPSAVTGKAGNESDAIPYSSTATAGQTTPPVQTPDGIAQEPGTHPGPEPTRSAGGRNYPAPPRAAEGIGQTAQRADSEATAADRAEIEPGKTLGVGSEGQRSAPQESTSAASVNAVKTVEITGGGLSPARLVIRPGQRIVWKNSTQSAVSLSASQPHEFHSGSIQPGADFQQVFNAPGVYSYAVSVNGRTLKGEVVVESGSSSR